MLDCYVHAAGWSSLVARRAHNPKVAGSNPAPAMSLRVTGVTQEGPLLAEGAFFVPMADGATTRFESGSRHTGLSSASSGDPRTEV